MYIINLNINIITIKLLTLRMVCVIFNTLDYNKFS